MDKLMLTSTLVLLLLFTECGAQQDVCGQTKANTRIVGGVEALPGDWPWQVSLHSSGNHFCGASLISRQWLLSAAHCFPRVIPVTAYLGRQSQEGSNPNEERREITEIINHPNYLPDTFDNDVALLKLSSPVSFTDFIVPVCLAAQDSTFFSGTESWVTGWGRIGAGVPLPSPQNLMEVEVPVVGNRQCNCDLNPKATVTDNMICAGLRDGGKDSCQGDSGGPMVSRQGSQWVLSGVVSFGIGCARPKMPGVYARVSRYQEWISNHTSGTTLPGFVTFTSEGTDPDLQVSCAGPVPSSMSVPTTSTGTSEPFCGRAPLNDRLSGSGTASARAGMWPWMASLHQNGRHVCGGSLVAEDSVLTSAECVMRSSTPSEWTVFLGRVRQNGSNRFETAMSVINITSSTQSGSNVAVLKLASRAPLSDFIQPICIESGQTFATGSTCWAAGWSAGRGGEEQALQEVQTSLVDCGNASSTNICTQNLTLDQEDNGGPLMCRLSNGWFQVAVLGTGSSNPRQTEGQTMVFPKVSLFNEFLRQILGDFLSATDSDPESNSAPSALLSQLLVVGMALHVILMLLLRH
ncbi:prostasin-like isoform X2 [Vanacampus margaritifer]